MCSATMVSRWHKRIGSTYPARFGTVVTCLFQLHEFALPSDMVPGDYPLAVGAYQRLGPDDLPRLPITINDVPAGDLLPLTTLQVAADE